VEVAATGGLAIGAVLFEALLYFGSLAAFPLRIGVDLFIQVILIVDVPLERGEISGQLLDPG